MGAIKNEAKIAISTTIYSINKTPMLFMLKIIPLFLNKKNRNLQLFIIKINSKYKFSHLNLNLISTIAANKINPGKKRLII